VTESNELDCKVYVESGTTIDELSAIVGQALSAPVELTGCARTIRVSSGEIEARDNVDLQTAKVGYFPDGFLFFRFVLEYYPRAGTERPERIALIAGLLQHIWKHGWAAVAACDYEAELPHGGGYREPSLPWPSTNGRSMNDGPVSRPIHPGTTTH